MYYLNPFRSYTYSFRSTVENIFRAILHLPLRIKHDMSVKEKPIAVFPRIIK